MIDPALIPDSELQMSNFDHRIDDGLEAALRDGKHGRHAAWNFNGLVWFEPSDGMFWERVSVYHTPVRSVSAATLRDLMEKVNDEFGWE